MRKATSLLVVALLLFSGAAISFGHEHGLGGPMPAADTCRVDHSDGGTSAPGAFPNLSAAGPEHDHECVACHSSRTRTAVPGSSTPTAPPAARGELAGVQSSASATLLTARTLARGPPRS